MKPMPEASAKLTRKRKSLAAALMLVSLTLAVPLASFADKKKKNTDAEPKKVPVVDYSNIVWPNPPAIARIRYQAFYSAQKLSQVETPNTSKQKWMDRLAGTQPVSESGKVLFQLAEPYGLAVDSKNNLYVADQKVGAIFIFNTETREVELIKNKTHAHFARIIGLAMDDNDRLFVSDPGLRHILTFDANHKPEDVISEGMVEPGGLALDKENRLLYVADVELDQVLVYDADSFKLLRKIGTTGHKHELTTPGDFSKPTAVAVDQDGNLYVCDTLNNRVEIFDADGKFVSTFGKAGDGPGYFSRPKGVAIDSDGHIWVADGMQDRVQVFNKDAQLLISFGGHGLMPGQFQGLVGIATDKNNRVFTSEMFPGRVQQFRYVTDAEAEQLKKEREDQRVKKAGAGNKETAPAPTPAADAKSPQSK
jgi:DNA-binding beta-propeller fold protein YncE